MKLPAISAALCLLFSVGLSGQATTNFTTPPGYLTKDGGAWLDQHAFKSGYAILFGAYAAGRYQQVDAELKSGLAVTFLRRVGFRLDARSHSTSTAMGRTWSNVTLDLAPGKYSSFGSTFTANPTATPTRVFSASVAWPSFSGSPTSTPMPWAAAYEFPFGSGGQTSAFAHVNTNDLVLDWQFTGGVLANAGTWTGSTSKYYYFDGVFVLSNVTFGSSITRNIGSATNVNCADTSVTSTTAYAYQVAQSTIYSKALNPGNQYAGKAFLNFYGYNMAPSTPAVTVVSPLSPSLPGVQLPTAIFRCYNLMINTSAAFYFFSTTSTSGSLTGLKPIVLGDYATLAKTFPTATNPLRIYTQGAWTDTNTLTGISALATNTPRFDYGLNETAPLKRVTYTSSTSSTTGSGPYDYASYQPISRYGY